MENSISNFVVDGIKLNQQLFHQKQKIEVKLDEVLKKNVKKSLNFGKQFSVKLKNHP